MQFSPVFFVFVPVCEIFCSFPSTVSVFTWPSACSRTRVSNGTSPDSFRSSNTYTWNTLHTAALVDGMGISRDPKNLIWFWVTMGYHRAIRTNVEHCHKKVINTWQTQMFESHIVKCFIKESNNMSYNCNFLRNMTALKLQFSKEPALAYKFRTV